MKKIISISILVILLLSLLTLFVQSEDVIVTPISSSNDTMQVSDEEIATVAVAQPPQVQQDNFNLEIPQ